MINQTFDECRVALVENGEIIDYLVDRSLEDEGHLPRVGNVYKGRVVRILPGMQAAFVDIGYKRAAFLHVDDAVLPTKEELQKKNGSKKTTALRDELNTLSKSVNMRYQSRSIESFLKEGDQLVVQVIKEPIAGKGPKITRQVALAGRYLVFMPLTEHMGVSRRIEGEKEKERLKKILPSIRSENKGLIARTAAGGKSSRTLKSDLNVLIKIWKEIVKKTGKTKVGNLVHRDESFLQRTLRDIVDEDIEEIIVDSPNNLRIVEKFIAKYLPRMKGRTVLYDNDLSLFESFNIDVEVERGLSNKIFLRSGGSLHIDQTEALVSIDVNTGSFVGKKNLEETILKINMEAIKEIAYQIRLRNCGGLIIIDFIDMEKEENRQSVFKTLVNALKKDRAKTNVLPLSSLGLVEMTRKRTRDTLVRVMNTACPYCEGAGRVKSVKSICYELIRKLVKTLKKNKKILISAHPDVTAQLCDGRPDMIEKIEKTYGVSLEIRTEEQYHVEQYEIHPERR